MRNFKKLSLIIWIGFILGLFQQVKCTNKERPEMPTNLKLLDKGSRFADLAWNAPYDGNSPITRYYIEYKLSESNWDYESKHLMVVPGTQTIASVYDLRPARIYHFRVFARNQMGDSDASDSITIITSEEAPSGPPLDLRVEANGPSSLRVTWKPPLSEFWNGRLQGFQVGYKLAASNDSYVIETVEFSEEMGRKYHLVISDLSLNTEYSVVVVAFNARGPGPSTEDVLASTADGTPWQPENECVPIEEFKLSHAEILQLIHEKFNELNKKIEDIAHWCT